MYTKLAKEPNSICSGSEKLITKGSAPARGFRKMREKGTAANGQRTRKARDLHWELCQKRDIHRGRTFPIAHSPNKRQHTFSLSFTLLLCSHAPSPRPLSHTLSSPSLSFSFSVLFSSFARTPMNERKEWQ